MFDESPIYMAQLLLDQLPLIMKSHASFFLFLFAKNTRTFVLEYCMACAACVQNIMSDLAILSPKYTFHRLCPVINYISNKISSLMHATCGIKASNIEF